MPKKDRRKEKLRPNDPCPCKSGKKYKKCCLPKDRKSPFSKKYKEKLSKDLFKMAEGHEKLFGEVLERSGADTSKIKVIDRSKFMTKHIPDVIEEMMEKYGSDFTLSNPEMAKEARESIEKKFHESLPEAKKWKVYHLLCHCKIPGKIEIDEKIHLVPFGEWPCDDYIKIMNKLSSSLGPFASDHSEELWKSSEENLKKRFGKENPAALLIFEDIEADSHITAHDKIAELADNITTTVSVLTNSHIETKGWLFEGKLDGLKESFPHIFFYKYTPTYTTPETLETTTQKILSNIDENYLVSLALKYQNESLVENEEKFRMLKLWSALEYIAEEYAKKSEELLSKPERKKIVKFIMDEIIEEKIKDSKDKEEKVKKIKSMISNNVGNINHKNAKDKVRDLLEWCEYPLEKLDEDKDRDILDLIYQHRNCITHAGGCAKSEGKECDPREYPKYCRESDLDLPNLNRKLHRMLKSFIGKSVGIKFEYSSVIPEDIKKLYD